MLKLLDSLQQLAVSGDTPFGCKIRSAAAAYGVEKRIAQFWSQEGGTALAKLDDSAILEEGGQTDWEELAAFLPALDLQRFTCTESAARKMNLPVSSRGEIMLLHPAGDSEKAAADLETNPSLRDIYELLDRVRTDTFAPPEFEPFYMDLSYRIRRGNAFSVGIRREGRLIACALCSAMTERSAILSGVACAPELRRHGFSGSAVRGILSILKKQNVYIFRAEGENEEFYRKLGFQPYGSWAEMKRAPEKR